MNKLYKASHSWTYVKSEPGGMVYVMVNDYEWQACSLNDNSIDSLVKSGDLHLIANNYQEKPKCSQQDSRSSSCHVSETTAKSSGLLSRICSVFSSNAKK